MKLDVLSIPSVTKTDSVLPHFERARAIFCSLGMEMIDCDLGSAVINSDLLPVYDCNALFDAKLPAGMEMKASWEKLIQLFAENRSEVLEVRPNILAEKSEIDPLVDHLKSHGWYTHSRAVYRLEKAVVAVENDHTVISARSAYGLYDDFCKQVAGNNPKLADYSMLKLDDPRYDVLVLLKDGKIAGRAGLLAHGEVGLIEQVVVLPEYRGQGLAKIILQRVIELCARSIFKHVLLGCDNPKAADLYASVGFAKAGDSVEWRAPSTR